MSLVEPHLTAAAKRHIPFIFSLSCNENASTIFIYSKFKLFFLSLKAIFFRFITLSLEKLFFAS